MSGEATSGGETEPIAEQLCPEDVSEEGLSFAGSPVALADVLDNMGVLVQFDNFSRLFDLGIVTVEVDGDWNVSPLRSTTELVGTFAALAEGIDRSPSRRRRGASGVEREAQVGGAEQRTNSMPSAAASAAAVPPRSTRARITRWAP